MSLVEARAAELIATGLAEELAHDQAAHEIFGYDPSANDEPPDA